MMDGSFSVAETIVKEQRRKNISVMLLSVKISKTNKELNLPNSSVLSATSGAVDDTESSPVLEKSLGSTSVAADNGKLFMPSDILDVAWTTSSEFGGKGPLDTCLDISPP